jgi:hypothetical protein
LLSQNVSTPHTEWRQAKGTPPFHPADGGKAGQPNAERSIWHGAYTGKLRSLTGKLVVRRCVGGPALHLLRVTLAFTDQRDVQRVIASGVAGKATPLAFKEMRDLLNFIMETRWRLRQSWSPEVALRTGEQQRNVLLLIRSLLLIARVDSAFTDQQRVSCYVSESQA